MHEEELVMPLRDHFRPPLDNRHSWEGFHACWPTTIVMQLHGLLPTGFIAEPRVHLGTRVEIDVGTFEADERVAGLTTDADPGGVATVAWAPPQPSVDIETDLRDEDEYGVRIYDIQRGRRLVASLEIVSPSNKDRPENRSSFVVKCAGLIQKGITVSIVDLVTTRYFNLYSDLLTQLGHADLTLGDTAADLYATTCRWVATENRTRLQSWSWPLTLGQTFPTLPLWLSENLVVPLDLESSYEQACQALRIT
jgi:hypothetical protein